MQGLRVEDQITAGVTLYGPRTTMVFYNTLSEKVQEYTLKEEDWVLTKEDIVIKDEAKTFAPGNLRAVNNDEIYKKLIFSFIEQGKTLRYSGGLASDIFQIFIKGEGIFSNISTEKCP